MYEISKKDWKLFCEKVPDWQERHMESLLKEYIKLLSAPGEASDRFWKLEKRIKDDKKGIGVQIELRKSEAVFQITSFISQGIINEEDLKEFSPELREAVKLMAERFKD